VRGRRHLGRDPRRQLVGQQRTRRLCSQRLQGADRTQRGPSCAGTPVSLALLRTLQGKIIIIVSETGFERVKSEKKQKYLKK
jgi:hypothetical protein